MRMRTALLAALVCIALSAAPAAAAEATVPVTKVTAFSSGVAYFEHNGKVTDDADVLLKFKTEQINDILKSLVVFDFGKGNVTGVSYGSRDPLSRALKSFGVDISGEPTLAELLKQVRGTEVVVSTPEPVKGKVLGVETKTEHIVKSNTIIRRHVLNLVTSEGIKAISLDSISAVKLSDAKLNAELTKALALLVESRDTNRKPVTISFTGKGARDVRIGYICEAPIWKTSYRLVLDAGEKKDQLFLQGWAIVENTGDSDWEKVELTLVSGRPISFIQDLYTPLYMPRPVVQPELYASLRPQLYEEGIEKKVAELAKLKSEADALRQRRGAARARAPAAAAKPGVMFGQARKAVAADRMALDQGIRAAARAGVVGELFSYRIDTKVTLPRRKSAMLPIINQAVSGRKVSIYNASVMPKNPLNGMWLINDTGLSLMGGPITVFDGGTYAGDARIGNLTRKDKRLLSYAIDLKVRVDPTSKSSSRITAVKINRGVLHITRKHTFKQEYVIENKAAKERTLVIEHPRRSGWKLVSPAEPKEKTPTTKVYRFEVKVPAGETGKFEVHQERSAPQTVAILPTNVRTLLWYSTSGEIPKKVRDAIAGAIRRKNALSLVERKVRELEQEIAKLRREQGYIRANMAALSKDSTGYKRFEKKLLAQETKIEKLQAQVEDAKAKVKALRKDLEDYINKLDIE